MILGVLAHGCASLALGADGSTWPEIQRQASERFGEPGAAAAAFLAEHRPARDEAIDPEIVLEAIEVSLLARKAYPWARGMDDTLFLNDVLPYAVLDEPREGSRRRMHELAVPIVEGAETAEEAVRALNRELFKTVGVSYNTACRGPNQGSLESMRLGMATCTGLSILLVDACRSVGIPARVAGIASWPRRGGNHTWVEIHDGERWRYTGAAEPDGQGLDRGWFSGEAAGAVAGHELHAVWASSWRTTGQRFPMAWSLEDRSVPGVEVTERYARGDGGGEAEGEPVLALRLWSSRGGTRVGSTAIMEHSGAMFTSQTQSDPVDINRVAEFPGVDERPIEVSFTTLEGEQRWLVLDESHQGGRVIEVYWDELGMSRGDAEAAAARLWSEHAARVRAERAAELEAMALTLGERTMRLKRRDFGEVPEGGRSLWISMHGGGGAPTEVNDRQWANQIRLYELEEGIVIAPRAPSDTWNLWHRPEVDALFDRLIESAVVAWGVDPDRVYLMGYSAGGDGVYQLAPRMADRFAAAAMMAGHPNDAIPEGLRNLPFALFMGAEDAAYDRNAAAQAWAERLGELRGADPEGYEHLVRIYPGLGHWMDGKDAEALPWMAARTRDPWARRVVWRQGNTPHERFYWLAVRAEDAVRGREIRASVDGQTIALESVDVMRVELLLSDALVDLDEPVRVVANGEVVFEGMVARTEAAIRRSLELRADPGMVGTGRVVVDWTRE